MSGRCHDRRQHHHRHHGRSRSCSALVVAVRVSLFSAATAAVLALYRQFRSIMHNFAPAYIRELDNGENSESNRAGRLADLRVAKLFQGIPGVEVYQSLRIPDPGNRGRREVDIVLLTKRDLFVLEVKNWSGSIHLNDDGSWVQIRSDGSSVVHTNLMEDLRYRVDLLESYLERRGVSLPSGFLQPKVFLLNRQCRPEQAIIMQREVISADQWEPFLNINLVQKDSGWLRNALSSDKVEKTLSEQERKQLQYILSTAPTWDRLELEDGKIVVGEFQGFKGRSSDTEILSSVKRSAVSRMDMTHRQGWINQLLGTPKVQILITLRDYRDANFNFPNKKSFQESCMQVKVRSETQLILHVVGTSKPQFFSVSDVLSLSLSS